MPNYMTYPQALELYGKIDEAKQDTLIAGAGINIDPDGRTISAPSGTGDMLKSVYDVDNDGIVDKAETLNDGTHALSATVPELNYVHGVTSAIQTQLNGKQNTLTFDVKPTDGSTKPVQSNGIFDAITDVYSIMGENGAKNIGVNNAKTQTIDGVTFTVNSDKSIAITGKNTGESYITYDIARPITIPKGHYKMSGSSEFSNNFYLQLRKSDGNISYFDTGSGAEFTLATDLTFNYWAIIVPQGDRQYNVPVKPMIYDARDTCPDYQPPCMTNAELSNVISDVLTSEVGTFAANSISKVGKVVCAYFNLTLSEDVTAWSTVVFSIPSGFKAPLYFQIWGFASGPTWNPLQVDGTGLNVQSVKNMASGTSIRGSATWITS